MELIFEFLVQVLLEVVFEGLLEAFFDLARGSRRDAARQSAARQTEAVDRLDEPGPAAEVAVGGDRLLDDSTRTAVVGVVTVVTSLAFGAWRGMVRAEDGAGFGLAVAITVSVVCAVAALRRRRAHRDEVESSMFTSSGRALLPTWITSSLTTSRLVWFAIANAVFAVAYVAGLVFAPT